MSFLDDLINEIDQAKQPKKELKPNKFLEFEKQLRDLAKSKGVQPRTFLEQLVKHKPELAQNRVIQKLIGEQDVPQQKGRDAKPEVLTKRAMNTVKKGIKQAANKQRRRMDKDAVKEDGKDEFSKSVNPMGQDSKALDKIKKSPGFYDMLVVFFSSAVQDDRDDEEVLPIMSSMFNMNVEEIKAVLRQYGGHTFSGSSPEDKFKANMGATGFLGKGKTRTVNSMYEGSLDQFRNLYKKSIGSDDAAVTLRELIKVINDDSLWSDEFPQLKQFTGVSPHSGSRIVTAKKIPGDSDDEKIATLVKAIDDDEWVNDTAKHMMKSFTLGEDAEQDTQYAKMIIQQNPQEYKKFMDTGDLMDAPTIYEKLFAYFSSSDASDMMPYGTQKARDGDPYVWLTDKLDDLGLTEGNEFAQKVRQLKAQGAKKGTKFKTSDGEEHTLEQILTQTRQLMDMLERKIQEQSAVEEDKTDKEIDDFHRELDQLVHKHFGHSSDEKKEKVKESVAITEEEFDEAAGKKDACYHKVKSRYKVWPSAYASGALVKCRKVGASNWGNKSK